MLCQECGNRPAALHFTKVVNGEKIEFHICEICAKEKNDTSSGIISNSFSIHSLISGLLDFDSQSQAANNAALRCEECGFTYAQFSKVGRFGCSSCYRFFGDRLDPLLKRVHGNTMHIGKFPKRGGSRIKYKREIEALKKELHYRIMQEEFENAAQVRDRIRELEKKYSANG